MNNHDRSRQDHYGDDARQDYYPPSNYSAQGISYSDANSHLYQQNVNLAHFSQAQRNESSQHPEVHIHNYNMARNRNINGGVQPMYYQHPQNGQNFGSDPRFERHQEKQDDERYGEPHEEVFASRSRTPYSGTRTSTERTTPVQTSSSRSTSRYGSYTTSSSDYEEVNWEDNIVSALNGMAGNLKRIGGIHCNQAGPDSTEVQLKLNLPLPMQYVENMDIKKGFSNAMASLSPKKCGNMQYRYSHLDDHVADMEDKVMGTMDHYKSLFSIQSESSDDDDHDEIEEDKSESTYEDPRFLSKHDPNLQYENIGVFQSQVPNVDGIPSQIIVTSQPSGLSSTDSWKISSYANEAERLKNKSSTKDIITTINDNLDVAIRTSKRLSGEKEKQLNEEFTTNVELQGSQKVTKLKVQTQNLKLHDEIPQVINFVNVNESYSDLTIGVQMAGQSRAEKDKLPSAIPMIKTEFSGDEIMGHSKESFQRKSIKDGEGEVFVRSDPPEAKPSSAQSYKRNKSMDAPEAIYYDKDELMRKIKVQNDPDDELVVDLKDSEGEEEEKLHEERKEEKKLEQRKQVEAKALAEQELLEAERLEQQVEVEIRAAREALKLQKMEEERKQREAEAKALEEALKAKRLENEKKQREAEAKAFEEGQKAKKIEERRKRIEAEAKIAQEALEAKKMEVEQKQREADKIVDEEARKAKKLEDERKRIEAETKLAQEALDALYTEKIKEEKRQREVEAKKSNEERLQREAEAKESEAKRMKAIRKRLEAQTKAVNEKAKKHEEERRKILAATKGVDRQIGRRKLKKENNLTEERADSGEKERVSLYKVRGFEDYCKSIISTQSDVDIRSPSRTNIGVSDVESTSSILERDDKSKESQKSFSSNEYSNEYSNEDEYDTGSMNFDNMSTSSNSDEPYSSDQESDIFTDATSHEEDSAAKIRSHTSDVHSSSTTERLRNMIDDQSRSVELKYHSQRTQSFHQPFSAEDTVNTTSRESVVSSKSFSKSKLTMKSQKFTSDEPIPNVSTLTTLPTMQTFDQGTVHSGQQSLGRFVKSSEESVISTASYSNQSIRSAKPIIMPVTKLPRETKKKSKTEPKSRSSILGRIISFFLSLVLQIIFTIIIFSYTWIKHLVITIGKKRQARIDCTPTQFALQPDQAIRREEIQDRSMDSIIHQNTIQQDQTLYLGYENPHREHYSTTMIIKPPMPSGYLPDDNDEVGTCVESIVPDAHFPSTYDGKISTWKITQKSTETSSLSSPPSTSFGILKHAYSALSATKPENEKVNWLDQPTIDDEMSYYE